MLLDFVFWIEPAVGWVENQGAGAALIPGAAGGN